MATAIKKEKLDPTCSNFELAKALLEFADYEKNLNQQHFKSNAYRKAARSVSIYPNKIKSGKEAEKLEGVGKHISARIDEFIQNGKIKDLEKLKNNKISGSINELVRVAGLGPSHAHKLVKEGIRNLNDLEKIKEKLTHHQQIGLKYFKDFEKTIPREEVKQIENLLVKEIHSLDPRFTVTICGSYRRHETSIDDIDVMLTHETYVSSDFIDDNKDSINVKDYTIQNVSSSKFLLDSVIKQLIKIGFITDTIAEGETKYMGVCRLDKKLPFRRLDIRLIPRDEYFTGLLYETGSGEFNHEMRKAAHSKGFKLNEYSLRRLGANGSPGKPLPISSEKDIFFQLGMDYKEPSDRRYF